MIHLNEKTRTNLEGAHFERGRFVPSILCLDRDVKHFGDMTLPICSISNCGMINSIIHKLRTNRVSTSLKQGDTVDGRNPADLLGCIKSYK